MVLATSDLCGNPWATPVYYAFDGHDTFFWYSRLAAKHSQLIAGNCEVAVTIFETGKQINAVYMRGRAHELSVRELSHALDVYARSMAISDPEAPKAFMAAQQDFIGTAPLRMYSFIPSEVYLLNESTKWHGKWLDTRSDNLLGGA